MLERSIAQELINTTAVTDLVGSSGVYVGRVSQDVETPWVTIQRISGEPERHQNGGNDTSDARLQIDCIGGTVVEAHDVKVEVRKALDNYTGTMGSGSYTTEVYHMANIDEADGFPEPTEGSQTEIVRRILDFAVSYQIPAVTNL